MSVSVFSSGRVVVTLWVAWVVAEDEEWITDLEVNGDQVSIDLMGLHISFQQINVV